MKFYRSEDKKTVISVMNGEFSAAGYTELKALMNEGAGEKHLPVVKCDGDKVSVEVGSVAHPMTAEHLIEWIALETEKGVQIACLSPDDKPAAEFVLAGGKPKAVYAYCNLHGLWKADV